MLNIAYIGNGKSANRYHIPFSNQIKGIRIKKILSPEEVPWEPVETVEYIKDIKQIWQDEEIDLVVICTPPKSHYPLAKEALMHGKSVLVEKPFSETSDQARELFQLAKEKKLFIECYQNRRFDSDYLTVKKVIESGKLGNILEVEMHFDYYRPEIPLNTNFFEPVEGFLYTHGCHTIDQVLAYFGEPEKINYDVRQLLGPQRMNDYFDIDFYYQNNLKVSVKSSYFRIKERPSFVVTGTKGSFVKQTRDRQEEHLKMFHMPETSDFGVDLPEHYGTITYLDKYQNYHEEKVVSEKGDYGAFYERLIQDYMNIENKLVKDSETIQLIQILEKGIKLLNPDY